MARFKVTDEMVEAGMAAMCDNAKSNAIKEGLPIPDWDEMPIKEMQHGQKMVRAAIQAAADQYLSGLA